MNMPKKRKSTSPRAVLYENRYIILAVILTAVIVLTAYAVREIYPFGDKMILRVDLFHQYAPYIEEMRSRVVNRQSLLYSWEGGLGKDHLAQMAYYTTSPLNLLAFLFPAQGLPDLAALLILLKVSLSAGTFSYYLRRHYGVNDLSLTVFGMLYAGSAYVTCYYWNIMWLDTIVLFPLVILGTELLMDRGRRRLYYAALTLTMIVNFYLAVLVCILVALYWVVRLFSVYTWKKDSRAMLEGTARFAVLSVLAAMTSLFILVPVASALGETEVSGMAFPAFELYSNYLQLIPDHFLGARAAVLARNEDLPNIYCGVLTMVLLPAWFCSREIPRRQKVLYSLLLVFLLLCCCIKPLDFLIHGLHFPANLPHRYVFGYSFLLLSMAFHGLQRIRRGEQSLRPLVFVSLAYAAGIIVSEFGLIHLAEDIDRVLSDTDLLLNAVLLVLYPALLGAALISVGRNTRKKTGKRAAGSGPAAVKRPFPLLLLLLAAVYFECQFSFITNIDDVGEREPYIAYMDSVRAAVAYMDEETREDGSGFYRAEFRRFTSINDASLYHYNGFSQFSSLEPGGISALMEHLGIAATGNSFRYYDPTPLVDAMFDIRYVMNRDVEHPKGEKYTFIGSFGPDSGKVSAEMPDEDYAEDYDEEDWDDDEYVYEDYSHEIGDVLLYRNERALPLGFMTDSAILDWETEDSDPFSVQNTFIRRAAGVEEDMFTLIPAQELSVDNLVITEERSPCDFNYELMYPKSLVDIPAVHARYVSDRNQYVYLYVNAPNAIRFIYANATVREDRELSAGRSLIDVGWMSEGEPLEVDFNLTDRGQFEKTYRRTGNVQLLCARYEDAAFDEGYTILSEEPLTITSFEDTRVEGTVTAAEDGILMTSIPYTKGWEVTLDGQPAEKIPLGDGGLIGVAVPAGTHTVVLRYGSRIFLPSVVLSVIGLLLGILYCRRERKETPGSGSGREAGA